VTFELPTGVEILAERSRVLGEQQAAGLVTNWGRYTYGAPEVIFHEGDTGRLSVGAYCSIALEVQISLGGEHRTDWVSTYPFRALNGLPGAYADGHPASRGDVTIGSDVWLGRGCKIRSGVSIGDGAVVGGYAVVTREVDPYTIVAGNPARVIRRRFSDEEIARLVEIRWWEWPHEEILGVVHLLSSPDISGLIRYAEQR
jgi:acetyltransferase-like isoleucine patch superfamily enzyme